MNTPTLLTQINIHSEYLRRTGFQRVISDYIDMIIHTRTVTSIYKDDAYRNYYYLPGFYETPLDRELLRANYNDVDIINDIIKGSPPLTIPLTVQLFPYYIRGGDPPCDIDVFTSHLPLVASISNVNSLLDTPSFSEVIVFRLHVGDKALVTGSGHVLLPMGIYEIVNSRICIVKPYIKPTRKTKLPSPRYFERKMRKYN